MIETKRPHNGPPGPGDGSPESNSSDECNAVEYKAGEYDAVEYDADDSIEQVFAREQDNMVRLAYLLLHSREQAEEAAQDAFARLVDRFDSIRNPGGFLRTATINRCRDIIRRREREYTILRRFQVKSQVSASDNPDDLHDVLAALKQRPREVVVLRYYFGHSHAEIGQLLDMNEATVRTTLHRALTTLRKELSS